MYEVPRIILQYEYCRQYYPVQLVKHIIFTLILPLVLDNLALRELSLRSRVNGPFAENDTKATKVPLCRPRNANIQLTYNPARI